MLFVRVMSCGLIRRLAVWSQSVKRHTYSTDSGINCKRQSVAPRVIPLSASYPQAVMVFGKTSALPGKQGTNTDGLFVTNANSEVLERPASIAGVQKEHSVCEPAVSAYKEVFSKAAMEGPGTSVSKVEAHGDKDGTVEGKDPNVGKVEGVGKTGVDTVGKSVGKSQQKGVGKTEGEAIGKFEGKGKAEGIGKTVGKSGEEALGKVGKSEGEAEGKGPNVGKAEQIGKSEGKNVGKTQGEFVGKAENESVGKLGKNEKTGKIEGDVGKADVGKVSDKSVGKGEQGDHGKPSEESIRQAGEKFQKLTTGKDSRT